LKNQDLKLIVNVDILPWKFGGWRKVSETLTFSLQRDFSFENMKFYTESQRIHLQPLDFISLQFEMILYFENSACFCYKFQDDELIGRTISYQKKAHHGRIEGNPFEVKFNGKNNRRYMNTKIKGKILTKTRQTNFVPEVAVTLLDPATMLWLLPKQRFSLYWIVCCNCVPQRIVHGARLTQ